MNSCKLCKTKDEKIVWQDKFCRFIIAKEKNFYKAHRLIWNEHISELSFLSKKDLNHFFSQLIKAEKYIIEKLQPHKINIASFGNLVPHLHWHIIPRWKTDPWWPNTIWDNIKNLEWYPIQNNQAPQSNILICAGDWTSLKNHVQSIRNEVFKEDKQTFSSAKEDTLDFISRHVVIKAENNPVATGKLEPNGKIEKLSVLKNYHNLGYERLVLKKIISEAEVKKFSKVFIHAEGSKSGYLKNEGFVEQNKEQNKSNQNCQKFVKNIYE